MVLTVFHSFVNTEPCERLKAAVMAVLEDDGFSLPSELARKARATATRVLTWSSEPNNLPMLTAFARELLQLLEECLTSRQPSQSQREKMWEAYHKLRTSAVFKSLWVRFLDTSTAGEACPIFYQYVTDKLFKASIMQHFPVSTEAVSGTISESSLTYEEVNALRHAAGYVPRALRKKLERGSHPMKEEMVLCLYEMTEDDGQEDTLQSEDWVNLVNRGGLKLVNSATYMLFAAMELCIRKNLHKFNQPTNQPTLDHLKEEILGDDDVQFHWSILSASWDEEEVEPLLPLIVQLWVTIRGFSYASAWMEKYKQTNKKSTQKTKGVRKQLMGTSTTK